MTWSGKFSNGMRRLVGVTGRISGCNEPGRLQAGKRRRAGQATKKQKRAMASRRRAARQTPPSFKLLTATFRLQRLFARASPEKRETSRTRAIGGRDLHPKNEGLPGRVGVLVLTWASGPGRITAPVTVISSQ